MRLSSLAFLIQEAFLNIRRNGLMSLAALGTVTVALTVLGASLWTAFRLNEVAEQQPHKFDQIALFLPVEAERATAEALKKKIEKMEQVRRVHLVTKERAWADLQTDEPNLTEAIEDNPLPDKLEVEIADVKQVGSMAKRFRSQTEFPEIAQVLDSGEEVRTLLGFARVVKIVGGCASVGLFIATLFIVYNTIRLTVFARRREIRTMQLVGATAGFIRLPLLLEGLFHGIVGAFIAGGVILICGREVSRFFLGLRSPLVGDVPSLLTPLQVVGTLVVIGGLIGLVGSYLAMRRFLKQV